MPFSFEELLEAALDGNMSREELVEFLSNVYKGYVAPGFYLRKADGSDELECWFRNVEESGQTMHGPTNYGPDEVVGAYKESVHNQYVSGK